MAQLLWYLKCLFPSSVIIYSIPSTFYFQSHWGILISFFLLSQIGMAQPAYAHPDIFHLGTTHMCYSFLRGCLPYLLSLDKYFQAHNLDSLLLFQAKKSTP